MRWLIRWLLCTNDIREVRRKVRGEILASNKFIHLMILILTKVDGSSDGSSDGSLDGSSEGCVLVRKNGCQ